MFISRCFSLSACFYQVLTQHWITSRFLIIKTLLILAASCSWMDHWFTAWSVLETLLKYQGKVFLLVSTKHNNLEFKTPSGALHYYSAILFLNCFLILGIMISNSLQVTSYSRNTSNNCRHYLSPFLDNFHCTLIDVEYFPINKCTIKFCD